MHSYFFLPFILISGMLSATTPTYQDILELEQVAFLDCMFTDMHGKSKEITIPRRCIDNAIKHGIAIDGSSISNMASIAHSDLLLKLNIETLTLVPWTESDAKTARVICNICRDEQTPHQADVRTFLEQALYEAQTMGYDFFVGPQLEFFMCTDQYTPYDNHTYFDAETNPYATSLKRTLLNILLAQNIVVEKFHHEVAPGQHAMSIKYGNALTIADQIMITKQTIHALANAHSLQATFMPKPFQDYRGSGLHIHCSLWDHATEQNIFYDENDPAHLSPIAKHFIAGILAHAHELSLIFNPAINSYKRLIPGFGAPTSISWGVKNRSTLIRIPMINQSEAARIEFRLADPLCCPYLVFGVLLKMGLDGIKNKMNLADAINDNAFSLTKEKNNQQTIVALSSSLEHAITAFEYSNFARTIIGDVLHQEFLHAKKEEFTRYNSFVTNWELDTYFES